MALGFGKKNSPDNDIKKLSRAELLEMLIDQTRLADRLRVRNRRLAKELEEAKANLERSASLQIIMQRLERIERIAAMHVGFTEEEIEELASIGAPEPEPEYKQAQPEYEELEEEALQAQPEYEEAEIDSPQAQPEYEGAEFSQAQPDYEEPESEQIQAEIQQPEPDNEPDQDELV
ncbi:MAG: hypothetical protein IJ137_01180 [Eubacterium sp.]|nr:hypothetical protein [Eubacterium sp.]